MNLNHIARKRGLWLITRYTLLVLAWAGLAPTAVHGIGISPGSASIVLELGNTNIVPITFTVSSAGGGEEGVVYWTTNFLYASDLVSSNVLVSSNLFLSFDPAASVLGFATPPFEGGATNGGFAYDNTIYVAVAATNTNLQEYEFLYLALLL